MNRRSASPFAAGIAVEERRRAWAQQRAPRAYALLGRVYDAQALVLDESMRAGLQSLEFSLGLCVRNGSEVDDEYAHEAETLLARALATVKPS